MTLDRARELLAQFGGAWLGPLWRRGGAWHRGLLSVRLDRRAPADSLGETSSWVDSLSFEVTGRVTLRRAVAVLAAGAFNHVTLDLRRPFTEANLLGLLAEMQESGCLRTLTLLWPLSMTRRTLDGPFCGLSSDFFTSLLRLPLSRHLTHLGSDLPLTAEQAERLQTGGVELMHVRGCNWVHDLPPAAFRSRAG